MSPLPLPDLGSATRLYRVNLTEREINAIHGANGFLQAALVAGPGSWKSHYCPALASASDTLERQTEGPDAVRSEKGSDFPELDDEQMPASWRPQPQPGTWSLAAFRWWLAAVFVSWAARLVGEK